MEKYERHAFYVEFDPCVELKIKLSLHAYLYNIHLSIQHLSLSILTIDISHKYGIAQYLSVMKFILHCGKLFTTKGIRE